MLELATDLQPLLRAGTPVAVVTVTRVIRSAPRGVGASLAVTDDLRVLGSISGGCVEHDAVLLAHAVLRSGVAATARFGFGDDGTVPAGLACGGAVEVLAYRIDPTDTAARAAIDIAAAGGDVEVDLVLDGPGRGRIVDPAGGDDRLRLAHRRPSRLLVLGSDEHAAALCRVAAAAGWHVTVCDSWGLLITPDRFPDAVQLVVDDPAEHLARTADDLRPADAVCVLTHDERQDIPALAAALCTRAGFIGAMGARPTVARRAKMLLDRGVPATDVARIHSPLGLDLGGRSPAEAAIAALAEITAARHGGTGLALRELTGPIHTHASAACEMPAGAAASCAVPSGHR